MGNRDAGKGSYDFIGVGPIILVANPARTGLELRSVAESGTRTPGEERKGGRETLTGGPRVPERERERGGCGLAGPRLLAGCACGPRRGGGRWRAGPGTIWAAGMEAGQGRGRGLRGAGRMGWAFDQNRERGRFPFFPFFPFVFFYFKAISKTSLKIILKSV